MATPAHDGGRVSRAATDLREIPQAACGNLVALPTGANRLRDLLLKRQDVSRESPLPPDSACCKVRPSRSAFGRYYDQVASESALMLTRAARTVEP